MSTDKKKFLKLMKVNQWSPRVFIDGKPNTISIQDIFTKDDKEFVTFFDQNNEQKTLCSDLIEVPTFTMD